MQCYSIDGRERIYIERERERAGEKDYMIVEERESDSESVCDIERYRVVYVI